MPDYGSLVIPVYGDTKPLESSVKTAATKAGTEAGSTISTHMGRGLKAVAPVALAAGKAAVAGLGLATTAAVAFGVKSYKAAEEAQKVTRQTAAVIKATGGAANVTVKQINGLTTAIMRKTGIDDESVKAGANMLLTFRNVANEAGKGNDIFNQSTSILTDMTAAMSGGKVTQENMRKQAIQLGKALNDPIKGISALARVGVSFTDSQKAQITAMAESGNRIGAQKIILGELNKEFKGAAAASATFGERAKTAYGELQESVGGVLTKAVEPLVAKLGPLVTKFGTAIGSGGKLAPIFNAIGGAVSRAIGPLTRLTDMAGAWLDKLKPSQVNAVADAIQRFGPALAVVGAASAAITGAGLFSQLPVVGPLITKLVGPIGMLVTKMGGLGGVISKLTGPWGILLGLFTTMMAVSPTFRNAVIDLVTTLATSLMPVAMSLAGVFKGLAPLITEIARSLGQGLGVALEQAVPLIQVLGSVLGALAPILPFLVKSFLAIYVAVKLWTAAQILLDVAINANAIGLLVLAIGVLILFLIGAWKHSETFRRIVIGAFNAVKDAVTTAVNFLKGVVVGGFKAIKDAIQAVWRWVVGASTAAWNAVRSAVVGELNRLKDGFLRIFGAIKGFVQNAWHWYQNSAVAVWNAIRGFIVDQLKRIWQGYVNIFNLIKGVWTRGWNNLISTVKDLGGRLVSLGASVIHNFLTGMGNAIKGIGSWIKSHVVDPVIDAVKHFFGIHSPSAVMADLGSSVTEGFISGIVRQNPLTIAKKVFGGIPAALGHMVVKGLIGIAGLPGKAISALGHLGGWFGNLLGGVGGFFGKLFGGGGGAAQWAGLVSSVLGMLGLPGSYLGMWLSQINSESGGNPNAINLTDINAQMGHPSQGLLQTIPSTFAAYAGPFRGRGITDPLANIYAAINYALHRYGRTGMLGVIGHGHGYASGGVISEPVAGFGLRSMTPYTFGERGPELVSPLTGPHAEPGPGGARRPVVINVYPQQGQSETAIAAAVSRRLSWAEATGAAS